MDITHVLKKGGIVCMPSDTVYGLFASALDKEAVNRLYEVKGRDENKPFIILINKKEDLDIFGATVSYQAKEIIDKNWPGPVTLIFSFKNENFSYLARGGNNLAFRIPNKKDLQDILEKTGPLVAPSANPQGLPTAKNIKEAKDYFGDKVDLYVDGGEILGEPSTIIDLSGSEVKIIRKGFVDNIK